jgi:SAM-dependent methyltransferase
VKVCLACEHRFEGADWQCPACRREPARSGGYYEFAPDLARADDGYDTKYFPRLATLEPGNFWYESRNALLTWALARYFPRARNLLEIGCGTGFVLAGLRRAFPRLDLSGGEISTAGLDYVAGRVPGARLYQMDARRLPFEREFDVVGAFDVLEHIDDDQAALVQIRQATRPGGGIMLTVPQHPRLWGLADEFAQHKRRYVRRRLIAQLHAAGFRVVRATSFVVSLLPILFVSRLRQRRTRATYEHLSELETHPALNAVLLRLLKSEQWTIRAGASWPLGSSLLVVAVAR